MSYKKRAKNGWCGGKSYKKESNRSERGYSKHKVRRELEEMEAGEDFRYVYHSSPSEKRARMSPTEREIKKYGKLLNWYEKIFGRYENGNFTLGSWFSDFRESCRSNIAKCKEKINKLKKDVDK